MKQLTNFRYWLARQALRAVTPRIDYTLRKGDLVTAGENHPDAEIVDVNWALSAVAIKLDRNDPRSGIVVWGAWSVRRTL